MQCVEVNFYPLITFLTVFVYYDSEICGYKTMILIFSEDI